MFGSFRLLRCLVLLVILLATAFSFCQTSIDSVHVTPREKSIEPVEDASAKLPFGTKLLRARADLVLVPVSITDSYNRPVVGLERQNFQLFENKKERPIKNFSSEDTPISVGIILDVSGSMANKLERARDAVAQFVDIANPQDEFFLITFSDSPHLLTDFTTDSAKIQSDLLTVRSNGRTSLLDAIYLGLREMRNARYSRRALLILSDGGDNHSRYSERDVKDAVREADVLIYAVGTYDTYVNTEEELLGPDLLRSITNMTGGETFTLSTEAEMPAVTRSIGTQLRHQYVLAYEPLTCHTDRKWYKINVRLRLPNALRNHFLHVASRRGYYAGGE
ncbi:MAG TPA: VWA domain-containing protein [Verrucomicrobiae bacterium]|jgi:Ca-activated chloride channel homolog|nr:VWA domain-containing protein [Verrucomicrobiae bacterium]